MSVRASRFLGIARAISWLLTGIVLAMLALLLLFLFSQSLPGWSVSLFFGDTPAWEALFGHMPVFDGIWPACVGTLALVFLSMAMAIPVGVAAGIYLAEYTHGRYREWLSFCVDVLAGMPSILVGLFGFALILFLRRTIAPHANTGLLLSALCLAVLVLPYLISTTRLAITGLPTRLRLTGISLGLSRNKIIRHILLPAASRGIFSGIILAIGRAAEDTAVILLTGAVTNAGAPSSLTGKYEALPFYIYYLAAEHQSPEELAQTFSAAVVLLCLTGLMFGCARWLRQRLEQNWEKGDRP